MLQQSKFISVLFIIGVLLLTACSAGDEPSKKSNDNQQKKTDLNQKEDIEGKAEEKDETDQTNKDNAKEDKNEPADESDQTTNSTGTKIADDPTDILVLVNKQHALPDGYIPPDLVFPDVRFPFTEDLPKKQMRKVAASAMEEMFEAGDAAGIDLFAQSGYRSYERQTVIFASNVEQQGEEAANKFSARPGESEHQTGLTMDVTSPEINYSLTIEFGDTKEGIWLKENAADYGFIIRYPLGKEDITEYQYEPWHIRYVGKKAAREIMSKGITLEEYLGVK